MKAKLLLLVGLLISVSTFTAQSTSNVQQVQAATTGTIFIGNLVIDNQYLEAWGDEWGNVTELYFTDSSGVRTGGQAYSVSGTYVLQYVDMSVQLTPGGTLFPFQGYCWI